MCSRWLFVNFPIFRFNKWHERRFSKWILTIMKIPIETWFHHWTKKKRQACNRVENNPKPEWCDMWRIWWCWNYRNSVFVIVEVFIISRSTKKYCPRSWKFQEFASIFVLFSKMNIDLLWTNLKSHKPWTVAIAGGSMFRLTNVNSSLSIWLAASGWINLN